jgi:sirohydrochlorin ferrochelatase
MKWSIARACLMVTSLFRFSWSYFIIRPPTTRIAHAVAVWASKGNNEPDLFEYFDPLLSPHAYPKGISPDQAPIEPTAVSPQPSVNARRNVGFRIPEAAADRPLVDTSTTFDPTLSPHAYDKGTTPDTVVGDIDTVYMKQRRVGILLMDHGSKNPASNERLQEMARLYQEGCLDDSVIVKAAHMEIATPSILDGIEELLRAGVDEIICHPYFLSPGRHVREDIPRIVAEALETLKVEIPVSTTDHVGSNTRVMIDAIHMFVQKTTTVPIRRRGPL